MIARVQRAGGPTLPRLHVCLLYHPAGLRGVVKGGPVDVAHHQRKKRDRGG